MFGVPLEVTSDNGPENRRFPFKETLKELHIKHRLTIHFRPQSHSRNERVHVPNTTKKSFIFIRNACKFVWGQNYIFLL